MDDFRFEQLEIWKEAIQVSDILFDYADKAEEKRFYKFAEQLRSAAMSISNNIAEGSGSFSDKEFANILHIYLRRKIISSDEKVQMYTQLLILSKKITNFRKSLTT